MKRILPLLYIICVICFSCTPSQEARKRLSRAERQRLKTEDSLALKVAVMPTADCFPVFVAKARNLFDTTKVDVRLHRFNAQMDCDTALAGGSVEGAFSDLMRTERLRKNGTALEYEAATDICWQLVSNKKARVTKPTQLADKTMGMTRFSATDYLCDKVLEGEKMTSVAFRIQVNDLPVRLLMLQNSELDAAWLPEPFATVALKDGGKSIGDSRKAGLKFGVLAFREKPLKDNRIRQQINAFIRGYNTACDSLNRYGAAHYADVLSLWCNLDKGVFPSLGKLPYEHAQRPSAKDVEAAAKYAKNTQ